MKKEVKFFTIADSVDSLFIMLLQNEIDVQKITWHQVTEFNEILRKEVEKKGIDLYFPGGRDKVSSFFSDNKDKFYEEDYGIVIKEGVNPWHLIYDRVGADFDVILTLEEEEVVIKVLKMMGYEIKEQKKLRDIEDYMSELKDTIDNAALEWDFERCISLKKKYKELEWIAGIKEKDSKVKIKTEDENK